MCLGGEQNRSGGVFRQSSLVDDDDDDDDDDAITSARVDVGKERRGTRALSSSSFHLSCARIMEEGQVADDAGVARERRDGDDGGRRRRVRDETDDESRSCYRSRRDKERWRETDRMTSD